ncbi:unnamed protein product [Heligmosomoides polygyrus]|uniref:Uncharacterized protein n=1 Tax=Heligmosomoides polygyrus TaxID=6339 RepID=A0A3P7TDX6_HELPZ|nr:unnamed protein product [Heligmosomoides polygyrus]
MRRVWNNLLVYWKKIHHYSRKPAGKIWPFEKPLRFIVRRYGVRYQPSKLRATAEEDGDDESCEENETDDVFDADDWLASLSADSEALTRGTDPEVEASGSSSLDRTTAQDNVPDAPVKEESREEPEPDPDSTTSSGEDQRLQKQKSLALDKFDKYAAFLASTLRDMPEEESKKKMKEIMLVLLEDVYA